MCCQGRFDKLPHSLVPHFVRKHSALYFMTFTNTSLSGGVFSWAKEIRFGIGCFPQIKKFQQRMWPCPLEMGLTAALEKLVKIVTRNFCSANGKINWNQKPAISCCGRTQDKYYQFPTRAKVEIHTIY